MNEYERLTQHHSKEFRMQKRQQMEDVMDSCNTRVELYEFVCIIVKGNMFSTDKYTYRGKPMYTIDYIIDNVKRKSKHFDELSTLFK